MGLGEKVLRCAVNKPLIELIAPSGDRDALSFYQLLSYVSPDEVREL